MLTLQRPRWRPAAATAASVLILALPARGADSSPPQDDAIADLTTAVRTLASERAGFTGFHSHVSAQQRAPGHDASLDVQSAFLRDGGQTVAVKIYSRIANGAPASGADLAKAQSDAEKDLSNDAYALPLREERLAEYRLQSTACDRCAPGTEAIAFTSLKRDANHGDGTLVIDTVTHHFERVDFVPAALPTHVDSATVTIAFGRVLPDLWDVVEMHERYKGHFLFISGGADITTTQSAYRRFATRDQGLTALASGL